MLKIIFIIWILCIPALNAQEKLTLSLEEAIQTGFEKSPLIQMSGMSVQAAEARARETATTMMPSLRFAGSYNRLSDVPAFAIDLPAQDFPANGIDIFPNIVDHYSARISVQQPLFTGFRLRENRNAARYNAEAERYGYDADKNELEYMITKAYWNLYRAKESERVVSASVNHLHEHLTNVENFYKEGMVTRNEVLKVQVQLSNTRISLIEAQNNVRIATIRLNNLIGLPLSTETSLTTQPGYALSAAPELEDYISTAVSDNPGLRKLDARKQMSRSAVGIARSGWYPQIYLAGNYYYQRPHQRYLPLRDEFNDSWDLGITVSFDFWNWGAVSHRTSQAKAQLRQTEIALEKQSDDITVEVAQLYLEAESAREQVDAARIAMEQAEENFRVTGDLYREEMVVNADVLDADVALMQARMTYIEALTRYEIAKAGLMKTVGGERDEHFK